MPTPEIAAGILIKLIGSIAGAIVNILFMPPRTKKGGIRRFIASLIAGVFAADVLKEKLAISDTWQSLMFAAALASFVGWAMMGATMRIIRGWKAAD